jgi:hypothetical protein
MGVSAVDEGEWSTSFLGRCTLRKSVPLLNEYEVVWSPERCGRFREQQDLLLVLAFEPWTVKPVAS